MKCQVIDCKHEALISDDEGELCLCMEHTAMGIELVHYGVMPEVDHDPQDAASIARRRQAVQVYKAAKELYAGN